MPHAGPMSTPMACPRCGQPMSLSRTVPKFGPMPELKTFACGGCQEAVTIEATDPAAPRR